MNEPTLPAMFMVPETNPACDFPISTQVLHEGESVMSAPKMHKLNQMDDASGLPAYALPTIPIDASRKPTIAGRLRELFQRPAAYSLSTHQPAVQFPNAPQIKGAAVNKLACKPVLPHHGSSVPTGNG